MIKRTGEAEPIGDNQAAVTWRVELSATPPPEWRRRFLEAVLAGDTIFDAGLRLNGSSVLFELGRGEVRVGLDRIDESIDVANAMGREADEAPSAAVDTILVVDDQPEVCLMTADLLKDKGYGVSSTADPHRALRMAAAHPFELLLTDVVMPLMNGRELAKRFLSIRSRAKVLFMSAYVVESMLPLGAPLIQKPFTSADLVNAVRDALTPRPSPFSRRLTRGPGRD